MKLLLNMWIVLLFIAQCAYVISAMGWGGFGIVFALSVTMSLLSSAAKRARD